MSGFPYASAARRVVTSRCHVGLARRVVTLGWHAVLSLRVVTSGCHVGLSQPDAWWGWRLVLSVIVLGQDGFPFRVVVALAVGSHGFGATNWLDGIRDHKV